MATYIIVDADTDPLGPNEIHAGDTISVNDGDVFIIDPGVDDDIKFESSGGSASFEVQINSGPTNDYKIVVEDDLTPNIFIADGVDAEGVDIDADKSDGLNLTVGDGVTLGKIEGSKDGDDYLVFGDNFTTDETIDTDGGDDTLIFGDYATVDDIKTEEGNDTIVIGDGFTGDNIETKTGDDSITIGDDATIDDIKTDKGDDSIVIGDNATVDDIKTDKGDDTITLGDGFTGDKIDANKGDDVVIIGSDAVIDDLDGGQGNDILISDTDFPDASNFENVVCFVRGTRIRTARGQLAIETLRPGDLVWTMDRGLQPIRWIGSTTVRGQGKLAPILITKGALGNRQDVWVSPQHRVLMGGWRAQMFFGEEQVLVPACHLVDGEAIRIAPLESVEYFHMLFDEHEIVFSDGLATESFHPGRMGLGTLSEATRDEVLTLFPQLRQDPDGYGPAARRSVKSYEGVLLTRKATAPLVQQSEVQAHF